MSDELWSGLNAVGADRRDRVFDAANAYLRAMLEGNPEAVELAAQEWERVAEEGSRK